jgi:hypothetical protein
MKKDKEMLLTIIEVERMRMDRQRAVVSLDKSLFIYFTFLFVAIFGFLNGIASLQMLNALVLLGILLLILGSIPYLRYTINQKKTFDKLISSLEH